MYSATQAVAKRAMFNRHSGGTDDQLTALINHIARLDKKQRNAHKRGDVEQACKLEVYINQARIRLVHLANPL